MSEPPRQFMSRHATNIHAMLQLSNVKKKSLFDDILNDDDDDDGSAQLSVKGSKDKSAKAGSKPSDKHKNITPAAHEGQEAPDTKRNKRKKATEEPAEDDEATTKCVLHDPGLSLPNDADFSSQEMCAGPKRWGAKRLMARCQTWDSIRKALPRRKQS